MISHDLGIAMRISISELYNVGLSNRTSVLAMSNAMKVLQACIYNSVKAHVVASIAKFKMLMVVFTFWCKELQLLSMNIMNWTILVATSDFKNCPVFIYILVKTGR